MLKQTGSRPWTMYRFSIAATGVGPNSDAIVQAIRAAFTYAPRPVPLEIRAAPADGGTVFDRIMIGLEIPPPEIPLLELGSARGPAFRICGADGTIDGPGSHELARLVLGFDVAAARLCYHLASIAHSRRALDRPAPWIYYTGPELPSYDEASPFPLEPAPGVYNATQVLELRRRQDLERALGDHEARTTFDAMRRELARIAVAVGRSTDGTGFDCDWRDLAAEITELARSLHK